MFAPRLNHRRRPRTGSRGRRLTLLVVLVAILVELAGLRRRGYPVGGKVVVRCRAGHLFTTIWIPAASLKSLRLGWWRLQRCPVGKHFSIVTPVERSALTEGEMRAAHEHRDLPIP